MHTKHKGYMKTFMVALVLLLWALYAGLIDTGKETLATVRVTRLVEQMAEETLNPKVTAGLVRAIIKQESGFKVRAKNEASKNPNHHSYGLMQISRAKAIDYNVHIHELYDPYTNLLLGTRIISNCLQREPSLHFALICYNAGEGWRRLSPQARRNAQAYALKVLKFYKEFKKV